MRYLITKEKASDAEDAPDVLRAFVYPEPYNFEHTPDEDKAHSDFPFSEEGDKAHSDFPFSEEGLDMACGWLNEQYENRTDFWLHTANF